MPILVLEALLVASSGGSVANLLPVNEHKVERILRVVLGVGVLSMAFVGPKTPWGYVGLLLLVTGLVGSCPLYTLLGFSTCSVKAR
jgi:hypothetical protein